MSVVALRPSERSRIHFPGPVEPTALISVIVPVRDNPDGIEKLLERLARQTIPERQFEVVIGDDGSRDRSLNGFEGANGRIRVVAGPPKTSYAARNRAVAAARGDILAFCDSDCLPDSTWLEKGLEALARDDVVAGEVVFQPPSRPSVWSLLTMDMFLDQERNTRLLRAVTANLLVRRCLFEDLGGFDESLPSGGDYDFARRAAVIGARLAHAPAAIVRHPTIDRGGSFLRKIWFTNRWSAVRRARSGLRPELKGLLTFVPIVGVALARRHALRPIATLHRPRLVTAGLNPGWREDLRAMPTLYFVVAYVAGLARTRGWLEGMRLCSSPSTSRPTSTFRAEPQRNLGEPTPAHGFGIGSSGSASLPNLIVIGAQKCGTSALHFYLSLHPEISMSQPKELNFFAKRALWERGTDWYSRQFELASRVRGESSPNYAAFPKFPDVPERMASVVPNARIIYLVRDPLERIAAQWVHNYAKRRERGDLRTTLLHARASYVARSRYYYQIQQYLTHFDIEQILVLDSHDLRHRRLFTLRRVFEFAGVDPSYYHQGFERTLHLTAEKRRATELGLRVLSWSKTTPGRTLPRFLWRNLYKAHPFSRTIDEASASVGPRIRDALGQDNVELLREDANEIRELTRMDCAHWSV